MRFVSLEGEIDEVRVPERERPMYSGNVEDGGKDGAEEVRSI